MVVNEVYVCIKTKKANTVYVGADSVELFTFSASFVFTSGKSPHVGKKFNLNGDESLKNRSNTNHPVLLPIIG